MAKKPKTNITLPSEQQPAPPQNEIIPGGRDKLGRFTASLQALSLEARRERSRLATAAYRARKRLTAPPPKPRKRRQPAPMNPKALARLTGDFINSVKKKGTYADGGNLYLQVGIGGGAKSWIFIYSRLRLFAEDSHAPFVKALTLAGRPVPPKGATQHNALFKIAGVIVREYAAAVEAQHRTISAYEAAQKAKEKGLLYVPVPEPDPAPEKSALIAAAEQYIENRRKAYVGLGSLADVPPDVARAEAGKCRAMLNEHPPRDPHRVFKELKAEAAQRNARTKLFKQLALDFLDFQQADPDNPMSTRTANDHKGRLYRHLAPLLSLSPAQITAMEVFNIIQPLRIKGRRSTAHKCRAFLHQVFQWAKGQGAFPVQEWNPASLDIGAPLRLLMNTATTDPARFSQPLKSLHFTKVPALFKRLQNIPRRTRFTLGEAARAVNKSRHTLYNHVRNGRLKAIKPDRPYSSRSMDEWEVEPEELFRAWPKMREVIPGLPSVALYALMFQILTASRPFESLGARWDEWDDDNAVWCIPWQRIKGGGRERKNFFVPLSPEATAILNLLRDQQKRDGIWDKTPFIFGSYLIASPGSARIGIPPNKHTLKNLLEKNVESIDLDKTLHGFRTSFRSWAERAGFPEMDAERALKHKRGFGSTNVSILYGRDAYNDENADPEVITAFDDDPLRLMLEVWAFYCVTGKLPEGLQLRKPADVLQLSRMRRKSMLRMWHGSEDNTDQTTTN
jgi:integrase